MARDYKYRANQKKKKPQQVKVAWWKWVAILILITLFATFLFFLKDSDTSIKPSSKTTASLAVSKSKVIPKRQDKKAAEPRYDFYTILPETEIVVPDYEINTRNREEKFGKAKASKYLLQAGSFRDFSEADKLRARLALMGIESRVEKAKVGSVVWNRVKIGPYSQSSSVSVVKKRLKQNNIDVIVTEVKG